MRKVYLDYNATTPVLPEVAEAMMPYFSVKYGNPASAHAPGREAAAAVEIAAAQVAALIGANADEIIFTGSGTESNYIAVSETARRGRKLGKTRIISSKIEHSSTYQTCCRLKKEGFEISYLAVESDGLLDLNSLEKALNDDVALLSLLLVNNETGTIQDFEKVRGIIEKYDVPLHYDGVQAAGKMPLNVRELGASLLSLSAHKIYGPKGIGAVYISPELELEPLLGTLNVPGIVGMGEACRIRRVKLDEYMKHCRKLRDYLEQEVMKICPAAKINGSCKRQICNTLNMSFPGYSAKNLASELDRCGVAVSTGAACNTGTDELSRVLEAMGLSKLELFGSLRFAVGKGTDKGDIDYVVRQLAAIIKEKTKALGGSEVINL